MLAREELGVTHYCHYRNSRSLIGLRVSWFFLPFSFGDFPRKNCCLIVVWLALLLAYLFVESILTHKEENAIFIIIVFCSISQQNHLKNIMPQSNEIS